MRNWDSNIVGCLFLGWALAGDAGHVDRFNPTEEFGPVVQQADADRRRSRDLDHPGAAQLAKQRSCRYRPRLFQSKNISNTIYLLYSRPICLVCYACLLCYENTAMSATQGNTEKRVDEKRAKGEEWFGKPEANISVQVVTCSLLLVLFNWSSFLRLSPWLSDSFFLSSFVDIFDSFLIWLVISFCLDFCQSFHPYPRSPSIVHKPSDRLRA